MSAPEKKKSFMGEFKTFIARGNVMDMAVGVIIGGAFGKISTSLVNDVIMPLISVLTGGVDFQLEDRAEGRCCRSRRGRSIPLRRLPSNTATSWPPFWISSSSPLRCS